MKWQYSTVYVTMAQRPGLPGMLTSAGQNGWELVNVVIDEQDSVGQVLMMFFKKPL